MSLMTLAKDLPKNRGNSVMVDGLSYFRIVSADLSILIYGDVCIFVLGWFMLMFVDSKCLGWIWCLLVAGVLLCLVAPSASIIGVLCCWEVLVAFPLRMWWLWFSFLLRSLGRWHNLAQGAATASCNRSQWGPQPASTPVPPQPVTIMEEAKNFECGLQGAGWRMEKCHLQG